MSDRTSKGTLQVRAQELKDVAWTVTNGLIANLVNPERRECEALGMLEWVGLGYRVTPAGFAWLKLQS